MKKLSDLSRDLRLQPGAWILKNDELFVVSENGNPISTRDGRREKITHPALILTNQEAGAYLSGAAYSGTHLTPEPKEFENGVYLCPCNGPVTELFRYFNCAALRIAGGPAIIVSGDDPWDFLEKHKNWYLLTPAEAREIFWNLSI